jgi:hypothetical protein
MRWPQESAITRRDEHLNTTRRLSMWAAGGATAASLGLAVALGFALPGHTATATSTAHPAGHSGSGSRHSGGSGTGSGTAQHHSGLTPPQHAPANAGAPPVVTSGGS